MSLGKRELGEQPAGQFSIKLRMDGMSTIALDAAAKFIHPVAPRDGSATKDQPTPPKKRKELGKGSSTQPKVKDRERRVEEEEKEEKEKVVQRDVEEIEKRLKGQESVRSA